MGGAYMNFDKLTSMSFTRFAALVGMIYFEVIFIGAAITQKSGVCLIAAVVWLGIILLVFPTFRKGGNE